MPWGKRLAPRKRTDRFDKKDSASPTDSTTESGKRIIIISKSSKLLRVIFAVSSLHHLKSVTFINELLSCMCLEDNSKILQVVLSATYSSVPTCGIINLNSYFFLKSPDLPLEIFPTFAF